MREVGEKEDFRGKVFCQDMQYLMGMRSRYNLPVFYQQFDMDKKLLSKEY